MNLLPKFTAVLIAALVAFGCVKAHAAATLLPNGEQCFSALQPTSGGPSSTGTGYVGLLGTITAGSGGTAGTYGGVPLTGGTGTGVTANITVSGGGVASVAILNPGSGYSVADVLSVSSVNIGNVVGFSVPVSSVAINSSLAGGSVTFYIPSTSTFKQTWFNADQASGHQNTNPVTLDANGCAIIYGTGSYRQVLKDSLGNIIWDQITTDTSANNNIFNAGLASGTPNAITVTDAGWNGTDGSIILFVPLFTNTGATTLTVSGGVGGTYSIVKDTATGAVALSGGELVSNSPSNVAEVEFNLAQQNFHILNLVQPASSAAPSVTPQGYLNLVGNLNGGPIQTADVSGATTVYYSPYVGNQVPVWNGSSFSVLSFSELTITLTSAQSSNTIYDACIFNNSGAATAVLGPAWSNSSAGSGSRGTGTSTAQLTRQNGVLVNAVAITGTNGATNFNIPALECTYVGSIITDATAGQVSAFKSWGQNRKWGIWNAYNRVPIVMQAGDSTTSWTYNSATIRQSNGATGNTIQTFTGLAEESPQIIFAERADTELVASTLFNSQSGVCYNSTTAFSGLTQYGTVTSTANGVEVYTGPASYNPAPSLGINNANMCESSPAASTTTWHGTQPFMQMTVGYRG